MKLDKQIQVADLIFLLKLDTLNPSAAKSYWDRLHKVVAISALTGVEMKGWKNLVYATTRITLAQRLRLLKVWPNRSGVELAERSGNREIPCSGDGKTISVHQNERIVQDMGRKKGKIGYFKIARGGTYRELRSGAPKWTKNPSLMTSLPRCPPLCK